MRIPLSIGELVIARATQEDLDDILQMRLEAARWLIGKGIQQWKPELITAQKVQDHFEQTELFIAKCNGCTVGSFSVQWSDAMIWNEHDQDRAGYIHKLVVNREFKGSDIGKHLLTSAESYIRQAGKRFSRLDCVADNKWLNRFYIDAGYRYVPRIGSKSWSTNLYEKRLL